MRTVAVCTDLAAPADVVWAAVKTPEAFRHVTRGMLRYPAANRVLGPWRVGTEVRGWTFLFGVIPFSIHRLCVIEVDEHARRLVTDEGGGIVRSWRHTLTVVPDGPRRSRYDDRIDIDAGPLTPVVAAFAHVFYRDRQRRWRSLAPVLGAASEQGD